ncbi:SIS domain-containing protein [Alicyclobacillus curvatus]|nr:SIS domain-containing protein [Alicyclobacillus curvatus]
MSELLLEHLLNRYPNLNECSTSLKTAHRLLVGTVVNDGLIMTCGNGGSAADSEHIVGELMKGFEKKRSLTGPSTELFADYGVDGGYIAENLQGGIRAISLVSQTALMTAYMNDAKPDLIFAQQVWAYGRAGDALICISTSGNSKNVLYAAKTARAKGVRVIALTGKSGGALQDVSDVAIKVPASLTLEVQELHLPVYHYLCLALEQAFYLD